MDKSRLLGVFCLAMLAINVNASLVEVDLVTGSGDGGVTLDATTYLEWLDITYTTGISYNDMVTSNNNSWLLDGWRYAATEEVQNLFHTYMPSLIQSDPGIEDFQETDFFADTQLDINNEVETLINYLGNTAPPIGGQSGFGFVAIYDRLGTCIGDCTAHHTGSALITDHNQPTETVFQSNTIGNAQDGYGHYYVGHFLVRQSTTAVPIPPALWLFGSGILGLVGIAKRKKSD